MLIYTAYTHMLMCVCVEYANLPQTVMATEPNGESHIEKEKEIES